MAKRKRQFFKDIKTFPNVYEFDVDEDKLIKNKGKWAKSIFNNNNPIVLELGCGKGDYAIALALRFPEKNFIGIDIKGDRIHRGARYTLDNNIKNIHFLRIEIQFITTFFEKNEIDEIWITFPDPHLRGKRRNNRLTSERFLSLYKMVLKEKGYIHLKTDSDLLYEFTLYTIKSASHNLLYTSNDLYKTEIETPILTEIQTYYEKNYLQKGKSIKYIKFSLN